MGKNKRLFALIVFLILKGFVFSQETKFMNIQRRIEKECKIPLDIEENISSLFLTSDIKFTSENGYVEIVLVDTFDIYPLFNL